MNVLSTGVVLMALPSNNFALYVATAGCLRRKFIFWSGFLFGPRSFENCGGGLLPLCVLKPDRLKCDTLCCLVRIAFLVVRGEAGSKEIALG